MTSVPRAGLSEKAGGPHGWAGLLLRRRGPMARRPAREARHGGYELGGFDGLGEVGLVAGAKCPGSILGAGVSSEGDGRDRARLRGVTTADSPDQLVAVDIRQPDVADQNVRRLYGERPERRL